MDILNILSHHYSRCFDKIEKLRDGGSTSYAVFADNNKYFLRIIKSAFWDTAVTGADIQVFLQTKGFPVPPIIFTKNNTSYIQNDDGLFILYEFIEGDSAEPIDDAEAVGMLVGQLHQIMKEYSGKLVHRDKHFYIGRYIDGLQKKHYPKVDEFEEYGNALWEKIKHLPRGYCHGDMHSGNIQKTSDGKLYLLDFDTSCEGFPLYDIVLFCNQTNYFKYEEQGYEKSSKILERFLPEYRKHHTISQNEINAFYDLIALYHFTLQATMIELYGIDCVNEGWLNNQLDWLHRWKYQIELKAR